MTDQEITQIYYDVWNANGDAKRECPSPIPELVLRFARAVIQANVQWLPAASPCCGEFASSAGNGCLPRSEFIGKQPLPADDGYLLLLVSLMPQSEKQNIEALCEINFTVDELAELEKQAATIARLKADVDARLAKYRAAKSAPKEQPWIEWRGGLQPVDSQAYVEVKKRFGDQSGGNANHFYWFHSKIPSGAWRDIIAYRVVK